MLSTKTKEHLRRWAVRVLPKSVALLGGAAVLAATALWVGSLTRVVTVTDSHGANKTIVTAAQNLNTILEQAGVPDWEGVLREKQRGMTVTPRDIDRQVRELSRVLGYALTWALQDLDLPAITALLG